MSKAGREDLNRGNYILLGEVGRPFGIKGEIRVHPYNPFSETFESVKYLWLCSPAGELKKFQIQQIRPHQNSFVVRLKEIPDRTEAEAIRGWQVLVEKEQLAKCREGEFYWFELIGLKVVLESGEEFGQVIRLEETNPGLGGNDLLVIKSECREIMIPFTESAVKKVDLERGEIVIISLGDYQL